MSDPLIGSIMHGAPPTTAAPNYELYDYRAVGLAAFLGMPLGGSILMAINCRRLGDKAAATQAVVVGVIATAALEFSVFLIPGDLGRILPILGFIATMYVAKNVQADDIEQHLRAGGRLASKKSAAGIGLAALVVILLVLLPFLWPSLSA